MAVTKFSYTFDQHTKLSIVECMNSQAYRSTHQTSVSVSYR